MDSYYYFIISYSFLLIIIVTAGGIFMYQNYIFDLYGTLVDIRTNERKPSLWKYMASYMTLQGASYTAPELKKAYGQFINEIRRETHCKITSSEKQNFFRTLPLRADYTPSLGEIEVNLSEVLERLYLVKGIKPTEEMISHWALMFRTLSLDYVRLFDGAREVLTELHNRGKKVCLLSNAQRLFTEPELRSLGIYDLFDDVFLSSDLRVMKPSPLFYGALLQKHHFAPEESAMIGNDWQADAWGAYQNGLASMYVHTAQSPEVTGELPPGCRILGSISEVLPIPT